MSKTLDQNWDAMRARIKADPAIDSLIKVYVATVAYALAGVAPLLGVVGFLVGQAVEGEVQSYTIWALAYTVAVALFWGWVVGRTMERSMAILDPPNPQDAPDPRGPHWNDDAQQG